MSRECTLVFNSKLQLLTGDHPVHLLETALHEECNYPATQGIPYWNWPNYPDLETSSLFNGGPHSLGGNGAYNASDSAPYVIGPDSYPHGTGGGCVTTGPFTNYTPTIGPFDFTLLFQEGGLGTNWTQAPSPHCLTRDLKDYAVATWLNQTAIDAMLASDDIVDVQLHLNSLNPLEPEKYLHGGAHFAVGGIMSDFWASPEDPVFFLHHGMLDRLWTKWQDIDPSTRRYQYNGTSTFQNPVGVTPEADNSTVMDFGVLDESVVTLGDVANPLASPYCYIYI